MKLRVVKKYKSISKAVASNPTSFAWCPDGEQILTIIHVPRFYVNIGYELWHYASSVSVTIFVWTISSKNNSLPSSSK